MRKNATLQAVCGGVVGAAVAGLFTLFSLPDLTSLPLTLAELAAYDRIAYWEGFISPWRGWGTTPVALALAVFWAGVARGLHPALSGFPFDASARSWRAWAAVVLSGLAAGVAAWTGFSSGESVFSIGAGLRLTLTAGTLQAAAAGAVAWLLVCPGGFMGLDAPGAPVAPRRVTAALGAAFGVAVFAGTRAVERLFVFLFALNVEVWHPGVEVRGDAALFNALLVAGLLAAAFVVAGGVAAALASDRGGPAVRLRRGAAGLAVAAAVALAALGLRAHARAALDWDVPGLAAAAGLPDAAGEERLLVELTFDGKPARRHAAWPTDAKYASWVVQGTVPATKANAEALRRFAASGRRGRYALAAVHAVPSVHAALWEPERAFESADGAPDGAPLVARLLERARLAETAPITPAARARLETLTDETRYRLRGRHALNAARAWARFGDLERARRWRETAAATGADKTDLERFAVPARAPLATGVVRGRARVEGGEPGALVVGLFSAPDGMKGWTGLGPGLGVLARLAASRRAGPDGSFSFERLGAGRYWIAVLAPGGRWPRVGAISAPVAGHPGLIVLDEKRPRAELGLISIPR